MRRNGLLVVGLLWVAAACSGTTGTVESSSTAAEGSAPGSAPGTSIEATTTLPVTTTTAPPGPVSGTVTEVAARHYEIAYDHPTLGPLTITVALDAADLDSGTGSVVAADATGTVVFDYSAPRLYELMPARAYVDEQWGDWMVTDTSGNVFIDYNPGRYNGVLVMVPSPAGFTTLGTEWTEENQARFYSASVVDLNGDGQFEISQVGNDCVPSCAGGNHTAVIHEWNGTDYLEGTPAGLDQISIDALGPVRLGMTTSELRGAGYAVGSYGCSNHRSITGGPGELSAFIEDDIVTGVSTSDTAYVTLSGIRVGSSVADVRAAYGANIVDEVFQVSSYETPMMVLRSPQAREAGRTLWFFVPDGKVKFIALLPEDVSGEAMFC